MKVNLLGNNGLGKIENYENIVVTNETKDIDFPDNSLDQIIVNMCFGAISKENTADFVDMIHRKLRVDGEVIVHDLDLTSLCQAFLSEEISSLEFNEHSKGRSLYEMEEILKLFNRFNFNTW